jgi:hypothetical protein
MEKVILVCREPGEHDHTVAMIEELFPECTVEVVMEPAEDSSFISGSVERMGTSFQIVPFLGDGSNPFH